MIHLHEQLQGIVDQSVDRSEQREKVEEGEGKRETNLFQ